MIQRLQRSLTGLLLHQFKDFWPYYLGALVSLWATHEIQSFLPFKAKELADMVESGAESVEVMTFVWLALGIIIFRTSSRLLFFYPARVLQKYLRVELLTRLEKVSPTRYRDYSNGQLFQVLFNDVDQLRALVGFALLQVGNIVIALFVLVPKIIEFNAQLVYALTPMLVAFLLFTIIVSRNRHLYKKNQDMQGEVQNYIMESYTGKKTVKNYHAEDAFIEMFQKNSMRELMYFYRAGIGVAFSMPLIPLGVGLSFLWGAWIIKTQALGASSLVLFSGFVFLFLEPLMFLSWIGVVFSRSYAAWTRLKGLVDKAAHPSEDERFLKEHNQLTHKEFVVSFWGSELEIDLTQELWTVLVGKTGCGKTHVIHQLAEAFRLRGKDISYVAQAPYLYNDSLLANIFLGRSPTELERDEAYELLQLFGLDYLAPSASKLFAMEVGENGKRLSGGQAKRLALVRSLMSGAHTLIWDDPFSSVDVILERAIITNLKKSRWCHGKTILLSSHRLSTVVQSEQVIYLDKDQGVVEKGDVQKLLDAKGKVYDYFEGQVV